jgi:hypothetical protein
MVICGQISGTIKAERPWLAQNCADALAASKAFKHKTDIKLQRESKSL